MIKEVIWDLMILQPYNEWIALYSGINYIDYHVTSPFNPSNLSFAITSIVPSYEMSRISYKVIEDMLFLEQCFIWYLSFEQTSKKNLSHYFHWKSLFERLTRISQNSRKTQIFEHILIYLYILVKMGFIASIIDWDF